MKEKQASRNARFARHSGADGIFLINHSDFRDRLPAVAQQVISIYPTWWVGVNCLDLEPDEVLRVIPDEIGGP